MLKYTAIWYYSCSVCCHAVYDNDICQIKCAFIVNAARQALTVQSAIHYWNNCAEVHRTRVNITADMHFCLHGKLGGLWVFQNPGDQIIIFTTIQNDHFHKCRWDVGQFLLHFLCSLTVGYTAICDKYACDMWSIGLKQSQWAFA